MYLRALSRTNTMHQGTHKDSQETLSFKLFVPILIRIKRTRKIKTKGERSVKHGKTQKRRHTRMVCEILMVTFLSLTMFNNTNFKR